MVTLIYAVVVLQSPVLNVCERVSFHRGEEEVVRTPGVLNERFPFGR